MTAVSISKNHLIESFKRFVQENNLFQPGQSILLAVSGGIDSVVMLHLFSCIQKEYCLKLAVAHVHHGLRGQDADEDELFASAIAKKAGFPFFSFRVNVRNHARNHGCSLEEAGRDLRFRFFKILIKRLAFHRLALAHQADDQAETILMNLFRGTGLRGLRGIEALRESWIIHPLLFATRSEIESWAEQHHLWFRKDHSNTDRRFLRNRIRWEVLPAVKKIYGPSVIQTISRAGSAVSEAERDLKNRVHQAVTAGILVQKNHEFILDIPGFLRYFISVQKELLMYAVRQVRDDTPFITYSEIERLMHLVHNGRNHSRVELDIQTEAVRTDRHLIFRKCGLFTIPPCSVPMNKWVSVPECGGKIKIILFAGQTQELLYSKDPFIEYVDGRLCNGRWMIRGWNSGDRFQPLGMSGTKKLHDFFIDMKIPSYRRSRIPILENNGAIIWIVGYRISEQFRVKPTSHKIVQLAWEKSE